MKTYNKSIKVFQCDYDSKEFNTTDEVLKHLADIREDTIQKLLERISANPNQIRLVMANSVDSMRAIVATTDEYDQIVKSLRNPAPVMRGSAPSLGIANESEA